MRDSATPLEVFEAHAWFKALTLEERASSLRHSGSEVAEPPLPNPALAERRAQRWRAQAPFTDETLFRRRLELAGLGESQFLRLLGEPAEDLRHRVPERPSWLLDYQQTFAASDAAPSGAEAEGLRAALVVVEPLLRREVSRLRKGIEELQRAHPEAPLDPDTAADLLFSGFDLPAQLMALLGRTMILELNVARLAGRLQGDTPQARLSCFLKSLRQREVALRLLEEYPVLARQLAVCVRSWGDFSLEFLKHLCADWDALRATFMPGSDPGLLVEVQGSAGDTHRGGRSVAILGFSSGLKLVYKPHGLSVDVHFGELLEWLNARGTHPPFRRLGCLDRGTYGWAEFVAAEACASTREVQRFYERQGGYLALLYTLQAVDFHHENLIAAGEHPVLVDLEALFHPRERLAKPPALANALLSQSVMGIGLLPVRMWGQANPIEGIDLSGLGGAPEQVAPNRRLVIQNPDTDEMRVTTDTFKIGESQNRPRLEGTEVKVQDYVEALVTGFTSVYRLLVEHRRELLAEGGPLARFAEDEVRAILRPTQTYAMMLQDSRHPDMLRDALERSRLFDRLWVEVEERPALARVIAAECADLHRGDVPLMTGRPGSRHLYTSTNECVPDFFAEPSLEAVRRRLEGLSEDDLSRQLWFIRASLTTLTLGEDTRGRYPLKRPVAPASREHLVAGARKVGDRIGVLALHEEEQTSWLGLTFLHERVWTLLPLGMDLYEGRGGIALFLAYLGAVTGEERYTALARSTVNTLLREFEVWQSQESHSYLGIGGFSGGGGLIYVLTHLGVLWDEPALLSRAESLVGLLPGAIGQDEVLDIIGGAAGCSCALGSLYRATASQRALEAALQCGDHLLSRARKMPAGIGWDTQVKATQPLTGFSHGAAGMAYALLELATLTGEARFRQAGLEAIAYERSLFSPGSGNWPDLREWVQASAGEDLATMTAWCHGAPGIGLARLRSLAHADDARTHAEVEAALVTTLREGFGINHSLCHGDLGNVELLLEASRTLDDPRWHSQLRETTSDLLASIQQNGWLCGTPQQVETPGLMIGLAGIGYNLLRLAAPERVPSVLTLAPPPEA